MSGTVVTYKTLRYKSKGNNCYPEELLMQSESNIQHRQICMSYGITRTYLEVRYVSS